MIITSTNIANLNKLDFPTLFTKKDTKKLADTKEIAYEANIIPIKKSSTPLDFARKGYKGAIREQPIELNMLIINNIINGAFIIFISLFNNSIYLKLIF